MSYHHHQNGSRNLSTQRKPALRLCSSSPRISAFERQLSLMKTPPIMQQMDPHSNSNSSSPDSGIRSSSLAKYQADKNQLMETSPTQFSSNSSDATLVADNQIEQINSLKRGEAQIITQRKQNSPLAVETPINASSTHFQSIDFRIPVNIILQIVSTVESLVSDVANFVSSITREDVNCLCDYLSELAVGIFVIFGGEILEQNKDAFLILVSFVSASVLRIAFKNGDYDSLLLQGRVVPIFETSNLSIEIKRSVTRLIVILQFYILFSILRITAIFKSKYALEYSKLDNLSIMGLGVVMVLLCLNLIVNALPSFRHYNFMD